MDIKNVQAKFAEAKKQAKAGNHLEAARLFLTAQILARELGGSEAYDIEGWAHAGASIQASKVAENEEEDECKRRLADGIRVASSALFMLTV